MANKKCMTNKEFKEIFNKYYGNFDNWGYEGVLTILALNSYREAKEYKAKGLDNSYKASMESADGIADVLRERKYFV